jgi:molybdopterin converting factor small subunit
MAHVVFTGDLRLHTGGREQAVVEASSYRAAIRELQRQFPALTDSVLEKFSVSIDGVLIKSPLLETLEPDSELVFFPRISGG